MRDYSMRSPAYSQALAGVREALLGVQERLADRSTPEGAFCTSAILGRYYLLVPGTECLPVKLMVSQRDPAGKPWSELELREANDFTGMVTRDLATLQGGLQRWLSRPVYVPRYPRPSKDPYSALWPRLVHSDADDSNVWIKGYVGSQEVIHVNLSDPRQPSVVFTQRTALNLKQAQATVDCMAAVMKAAQEPTDT